MGVKKLRPITASMRFAVVPDFKEITKTQPERSLLKFLKKSGGRNNAGRVTSRRRGGGHRRNYRFVDFKRDRFDEPAKVLAIEYDPNRSARLALVEYQDKQRRYILWPKDLAVGETVLSAGDYQAEIKPGNSMKLKYIPLGTLVHNIELEKSKGGVFVRSAGSWAQVMAKEGGRTQLKLPSGEIRLVDVECRATVGQLGNFEHSSLSLGKAGRRRWRGWRSKVRGVAMNPVDHPHGGGEGKAGQGNPHPVTPWGKPTKGGKTRKPKKKSNIFIIKRREKKRRKKG
ncbi:MAG: 50S ribosomal protein L2 [Candidatus Omnitrophica bacterium]|nr:50S ribosomal protein L2 [Candidatus Omnitrophota bacterium]